MIYRVDYIPENKINPIPKDSADNAEELDVQTAEDTAEEAAEVSAEDAAEEVAEVAADDADDEAEAENEADVDDEAKVDEAEDDDEASDSEAEEPAPVKKKKMKTGAKVVIGILVSILAITVLGMAAIFIASLPPKVDLEDVAVSVDGVDSTAAEFYQTYIYYYSYNSYYGYSDAQLKELTIDQLVFTNTLYAEAMKNGFELSEEAKAELADQIASVRTTAEAESMSAD